MNWLKKLFGVGNADAAPPPAAAKPREARQKPITITPGKLAKQFAAGLSKTVGASAAPIVDVFDGGEPRDDGLIMRVTFTHEGVVSRLVMISYDGAYVAWLQTRCIGTYGDFNLEHLDPNKEESRKDDDEAPEPRFFLTRECYVSGPRLKNEVARIRTLAASVQERLIALALKVDLVKLDEQVLAVVLGDPGVLHDILNDEARGVRYLLGLVSELTFLAKQFPQMPEEVLELAEARTCRFCSASFIFSPAAPSCTACGAPADKASLMPPPPVGVIPDDPLEDIDEDDPDDVEWRRERAEQRMAHAAVLAKLVENPRVREDRERARVFVEYTLKDDAGQPRPFRAKIMDEYIGIRTPAKGAKGDFFLMWSTQDVGGEQNPDNFWHESERAIFFSKHCRVRSGHGTKEAARLASLPATARAKLTELCERFESKAQLEDEWLALGIGVSFRTEGVELVVPASRELARIADALPRDFDDRDPVLYRLKSCGHCGWAFFLEEAQAGCSHCGAPVRAE